MHKMRTQRILLEVGKYKFPIFQKERKKKSQEIEYTLFS